MNSHEIGDGDGRGIPGVHACVLVPQGSSDDWARVWREFGYELIDGEVLRYGIRRSSEMPEGTWVSLLKC